MLHFPQVTCEPPGVNWGITPAPGWLIAPAIWFAMFTPIAIWTPAPAIPLGYFIGYRLLHAVDMRGFNLVTAWTLRAEKAGTFTLGPPSAAVNQ